MADHAAVPAVRALFTEKLQSALTSATPAAVGYLDLDDFKVINDSLGHDAGDAVLRAVADRLQSCFAQPDTVVRLGGDEFAVLTFRVDGLPAQGQRLLTMLGEPLQVGARTVRVSASVGIAISDGRPTRPEDLRKNVDLAMYAAKAQGKNRYALFTPSMRHDFDRELMWRAELHQALVDEALHVAYQPIVGIGDRRVVGVEALARWDHPVLGSVAPDLFIPVAERAALIGELGMFVLRRACAEFHAIGLTAVAEGVEDPVQAEMLIELGCPLGQGFLFGQPGPLAGLALTAREPQSSGAGNGPPPAVRRG
jgi:diguanylate cyclase (GGDEF)-like protein